MVNQLEFSLLASWNPEQIKGRPCKEQAVGHSAVKPWLILVANLLAISFQGRYSRFWGVGASRASRHAGGFSFADPEGCNLHEVLG